MKEQETEQVRGRQRDRERQGQRGIDRERERRGEEKLKQQMPLIKAMTFRKHFSMTLCPIPTNFPDQKHPLPPKSYISVHKCSLSRQYPFLRN